MDDSANGSLVHARGTHVTGAVILVLMLYVLSPGPVEMFLHRLHYREPEWIGTLYMPLQWVFNMMPENMQDAYRSYVRWWDASGHP